jgi:hypothetical protein
MSALYTVIDVSTKAILALPKSFTTAIAVSKGMINTDVVVIPIEIDSVAQELKQFDFEKDKLRLTPKQDTWIGYMPELIITKEYMDRKKIASVRAHYIHALEEQFRRQNERSVLYFDESIMAFLIKDMEASDPKTDTYANGIVEYASAHNISNKTAYEELTLMLETSGLIKMRNFAWFGVYVDKFNKLSTRDELRQGFKDACHALVRNAHC